MHVHLLGICGTFMAGLAVVARQAGHRVTGSDEHVYPPMSTMLEAQGIAVMSGYSPAHLKPAPDCVVVGNAMVRGNPAVEYMLDADVPFTSGPQWLHDNVLVHRHVLAVAGTHGKTTTSSMLAWILDRNGRTPGFLIGGLPANFGVSARLGESSLFVIEADEYDTAFFDKRSKFVHYRPRTLVLNNLEFDHADIFPDLAAIQRQVHHVVRIVPSGGRIVVNAESAALAQTLRMGSWTPVARFGWSSHTGRDGMQAQWQLQAASAHDDAPMLLHEGVPRGRLRLALHGRHNQENALAAIAAAAHVGVEVNDALEALASFVGVARRLERIESAAAVRLYDDFAHHPTAISRTLEAVREQMAVDATPGARLLVAVEPRSNSMRMGIHGNAVARALARADGVWMFSPAGLEWDPRRLLAGHVGSVYVSGEVAELAKDLAESVAAGDYVVLMSNGGFGGLRRQLDERLRERFPRS